LDLSDAERAGSADRIPELASPSRDQHHEGRAAVADRMGPWPGVPMSDAKLYIVGSLIYLLGALIFWRAKK
jgi:hypothetical protein